MDACLDQPSDVRAGEELDIARLDSYLREHLEKANGPLSVKQFPAGYSNLTYLLQYEHAQYVLRRPPFGNRVKSAHDMGREYRVLSRLSTVYPLAPRPFLFCDDESVLGAPFYVMERRAGVIIRKRLPPGMDRNPDRFRRLSESFIDNLAQLHKLDFHAAGLGDLGRPEGFVERQVRGWSDRYRRAQTETVADMDRCAEWLVEVMPEKSSAALIHNDYKLDNVVVDPQHPTRILAVLDWEMSTIGDPLMDLGCSLAYWVDASDPAELQQTAFGPTNLPGGMTRGELVERYADTMGTPMPAMLFYYSFGLFKLAVIVQQIYARFARGHTVDARFAGLNRMVAVLARTAERARQRGTM